MYLTVFCCFIIAQITFSAAAPEPVVVGIPAAEPFFEDDYDCSSELDFKSEFPYMAHLKVRGNYKDIDRIKILMCGGVIITNNAVLTAAQCLSWSLDRPEVLVTAGISHTLLENGKGQPIFMRDYMIHEKFIADEVSENGSRIYMQHDIAIIWLEKDFEFDDKVTPATFLSFGEFRSVTGFVVGWGAGEDMVLNPMLQKGEMRIWQQESCRSFYQKIQYTEEMMCAISDIEETVPCLGDAGGPFVVGDHVVALISFNTHYYKHLENNVLAMRCNPKIPAVFTNLKYYREWIMDQIDLGSPMDRISKNFFF